MGMHGSCSCNNIEIAWQVIDHSLVPRACQCDYCLQKSAAYVCKSGTTFEVTIRSSTLHRALQHGSNSAVFHECANCGQFVFVTAEIQGELYGALNANLLNNKLGFSAAVNVNFSEQSAAQKQQRWRQNWCHPVLIKYLDK
jgi:hypothetical protein